MRALLAAATVAAVSGCGAERALYVIDQIEDTRATLLGVHGEVVGVAVSELPEGACEGDVLVDGRVDPAERERLQEEAEALRRQLSAGDDRADIDLGAP